MLTRKETGRECPQIFIFSFDLFHFPLISKQKSKQKGRVGCVPSHLFSPTAFYRYLDWAKPGGLWELVNVVTCGHSHRRLAETASDASDYRWGGGGACDETGRRRAGPPRRAQTANISLRPQIMEPGLTSGGRREGQGRLHYDWVQLQGQIRAQLSGSGGTFNSSRMLASVVSLCQGEQRLQ